MGNVVLFVILPVFLLGHHFSELDYLLLGNLLNVDDECANIDNVASQVNFLVQIIPIRILALNIYGIVTHVFTILKDASGAPIVR